MKKKIFSILAAAMICAAFTGCGKGSERSTPMQIIVDPKAESSSDTASSDKANSEISPTASSVTSAQNETSSADPTISSVQSSAGEISSPVSSLEEYTPPLVSTSEFDAEFFKDDLFIGDSIFTGLYLYSYLDQKNVAAAIGYTAYGAQSRTFDENFYSGSATDYARYRQPKRIIIMLGSNSLSPLAAADNYEDFIYGYRGLLETLKSDCPSSLICVVSVSPITADSSMASYSGVTNTIIDEANENLRVLCSEVGVIYYDLNSFLKDENGYFSEKYAAADGMHFLGTTYPVFLSCIQALFE